ncbi:hypothetical protein HMI55_003787 [Coelomomyces lativittatus]|nr:hypothetical protein HMI55_003787 [Coelomomyces lativittatus]
MFSYLRDLFPDPTSAAHLPYFEKNQSDQFEARTVMVEIMDSKSIFFNSMVGTCLPIPVAHGEGLTQYPHAHSLSQLKQAHMTALRYVSNFNEPSETYPINPNGSQEGWTGFTSSDGRITLLMPHPERATRWVGQSWIAEEWRHAGYHGPWLKMFENARRFIG